MVDPGMVHGVDPVWLHQVFTGLCVCVCACLCVPDVDVTSYRTHENPFVVPTTQQHLHQHRNNNTNNNRNNNNHHAPTLNLGQLRVDSKTVLEIAKTTVSRRADAAARCTLHTARVLSPRSAQSSVSVCAHETLFFVCTSM